MGLLVNCNTSPLTTWAIHLLRATTVSIQDSLKLVSWIGLLGCGKLRRMNIGVISLTVELREIFMEYSLG